MKRTEKTLFLFSSDARPLYINDVLALIAAPVGYRTRFRYEAQWVSAEIWDMASRLKGRRVLVNYSSQAKRTHDAVFVPICVGRVIKSDVVGGAVFIDFEVVSQLTTSKADYSAEIRNVLDAYPLHAEDGSRRSATIGPDLKDALAELGLVSHTEAAGLETALVQQATTMRGLLTSTSQTFFRPVKWTQLNRWCWEKDPKYTKGRVVLKPGTQYEVELLRHQGIGANAKLGSDPDVEVAAGPHLDTRGVERIKANSRFDLHSVVIDTADIDKTVSTYIDFSTEFAKEHSTLKPKIESRINVKIKPRYRSRFALPAAAALGTATVAVATSGLLASGPTWARWAVAVGGPLALLVTAGFRK